MIGGSGPRSVQRRSDVHERCAMETGDKLVHNSCATDRTSQDPRRFPSLSFETPLLSGFRLLLSSLLSTVN